MKKYFCLNLVLIIFVTGCSNYINKIHHQLDDEMNVSRKRRRPKRDRFAFYRKGRRRGQDYRRRLDRKGRRTSASLRELRPRIKRKYQKNKVRHVAKDLEDNSDNGSLWSGMGQDNFLFAKNRTRRNGDIIIVKVQEDLKNDITMELKRSFPNKKKKRKKGAKKKAAKKGAADVAAATPKKKKKAVKASFFDKISSVIIEEISKNHLLVRGRKEVLFKKKKRIVEIEALIARRDIADDDTVKSNNILESSVTVLR